MAQLGKDLLNRNSFNRASTNAFDAVGLQDDMYVTIFLVEYQVITWLCTQSCVHSTVKNDFFLREKVI